MPNNTLSMEPVKLRRTLNDEQASFLNPYAYDLSDKSNMDLLANNGEKLVKKSQEYFETDGFVRAISILRSSIFYKRSVNCAVDAKKSCFLSSYDNDRDPPACSSAVVAGPVSRVISVCG